MTILNDLTPAIDPALIASHHGAIVRSTEIAKSKQADARNARKLAKAEGVDLDVRDLLVKRAKFDAHENIRWLNLVLHSARALEIAGLKAVPLQQPPTEALDAAAIEDERFNTGRLHGLMGLPLDNDLFDAATKAGQAYAAGHRQGCEEAKNLPKPMIADAPAEASETKPRGRPKGSKNRPTLKAEKPAKAKRAAKATEEEPAEDFQTEIRKTTAAGEAMIADFNAKAEQEDDGFAVPMPPASSDLPPMPAAVNWDRREATKGALVEGLRGGLQADCEPPAPAIPISARR